MFALQTFSIKLATVTLDLPSLLPGPDYYHVMTMQDVKAVSPSS